MARAMARQAWPCMSVPAELCTSQEWILHVRSTIYVQALCQHMMTVCSEEETYTSGGGLVKKARAMTRQARPMHECAC